MIGSLSTAVTGLQGHQDKMNTVGDNIANVNTHSFKGTHTRFEDLFNQTMQGATAPLERGGSNPIEVGMGMQIGANMVDHSQGGIETTGRDSDLAIEGNGFFAVNDGVNDYYTRDGSLDRDSEGYLVNNAGMYVMGWEGDADEIDPADEMSPLHIPLGEEVTAEATESMAFGGNLDSNKPSDEQRWIDVMECGFLRARALEDDVSLEVDLEPEKAGGSVINDGADSYQGEFELWMDEQVEDGTLEFDLEIGGYDETVEIDLDDDDFYDPEVIRDAIADEFDDEDELIIESDDITIEGEGTREDPYRIAIDINKEHTIGSVTVEDEDLVIHDEDGEATHHWITRVGNEVIVNIDYDAYYDDDGNLDGDEPAPPTAEDLMELLEDEAGDIMEVEIDEASRNEEVDVGDYYDAWDGVDEWEDDAPLPESPIIMHIDEEDTMRWDLDGPAETRYRMQSYVYDSQGNRYDFDYNFYKVGANEWEYEISFEDEYAGVEEGGTGTLMFDESGQLDEDASDISNIVVEVENDIDVETLDIEPNFEGVTQLADDSEVVVREQDGFEPGEMIAYDVETNGVVNGIYDNGATESIGRIAITTFVNPEGLSQEGQNLYSPTANSGDPRVGFAQDGERGEIQAGALEMSNIDLSEEFTEMITTNRGFQANTRVVTSSDEILQEVLNMKR